jgi:hypothetical protein
LDLDCWSQMGGRAVGPSAIVLSAEALRETS